MRRIREDFGRRDVRLAQQRTGTPEGDWAAAELTRVKELIAEARDL